MPEQSVGPGPTACPRCGLLHGPAWAGIDCPPPDLVAQVRAFVAAWEADATLSRDPRDVGGWLFAVTMADNPHWYAMRHQAWAKGRATGQGFDALYDLVRRFHYLRRWHRHPYRSVDLDGYSYWIVDKTDGNGVNRKPSDGAGWDAEPQADATLF